MSKKKNSRTISIDLDHVALLCLNVDYKLPYDLKDQVEELSITLQKKFKFDSYEWRISKGLSLEDPEIRTLKKRVEVLESACRSGVGYEPIHGLEPRKFSEALAESSRIAKGEV